MICPLCAHTNSPGNRFCAACGAELAPTCPACDAPYPPGSNFCGKCGADLHAESSPAAVAGPGREERRLVSVLFADLVGFTPYSESRDPEDVRAMLTTYFDRSRTVIEQFAGSVDKFIGDAVMAVWGAVESHEDDAERAVRAGLELVDMVAGLGEEIGVPELALRAGVLTGETSVGPGGNERGLVVGDLVNTASRLQSIAPPGAVLVGEPTERLTGAAVQYEPLGPQRVKGKDEPVTAFRALRVLGERGGRRRGEGLEAPFTGRDVELRLLKDQLHAGTQEGGARLVSVVGEAGIGKSRLAWEFEKYVDGLALDVYWHRGRSPAYGDGLTMWALGEMVRSRAGIVEGDDATRSRLRLRTAVAEYVPSEDDRRWLEPRLAALLGLDDAPAGSRDELFAAIRTFFHHIAGRGPTALVFEDLHWADSALLDFVAELVERSPRHPILVITLARPELLEDRPGWGSGRRNFLSLHLAPLRPEAMTELVAGMAPGIPDDAVAGIVARAGGIPLYAVEFVRMLVNAGDLVPADNGYRLLRGVDDLALPDTVQAVIGSRLDRLTPEDRLLIQDAAVLGQSFFAEGLGIIRETPVEQVRDRLDGLVRQQLLEVEDDPRSPERGQYRFVQSVIREVAYGRLTRADRHTRHLRVAEYFAGIGEVELAGAVASHYLAAHETAPAGTGAELLENARSALVEAAARAADLQSHAAALHLLDQALEIAGTVAERAPVLEAAAWSAFWLGDAERAVAAAAEAVHLYEELGDEAGRLRAVRRQGFALSSYFRADEAVVLLDPVFAAIDDPASPAELGLALETARAHMLNQEHGRAVEILDAVMGAAEAVLGVDAVIDGIVTKATALAARGRLVESAALLTGAVALADEHELQAQAIRALNNLAVVQLADAPRHGLALSEELLARCRRLGAEAWVYRAAADVVDGMVSHGRFAEAEALIAEFDVADAPALQRELFTMLSLRIQMLRGSTPDLIAAARAATAVWEDATDPQMRSLLASVLAAIDLMEGRLDEAFRHSLEEREVQGLAVAVFAAAMLRDKGRLARATTLIDELAHTTRVAHALHLTAEASELAIDGEREAAARAFGPALELWARIAAPIQVAAFQVLFAALVGLDHPDARQAGSAARDWIRSAGARHLETVWAEGLPPDPGDAISRTG